MVMKKFMDDNFMLNNETAVKLFNDYAKDMPIFDYHCHLSPQMMRTSRLKILLRFSWAVTIISGDICVQTVLTRVT